MTNNGWIKIHRKISEKGWYKHSDYVHLWVHLLIKASHCDKEFFSKGRTVILKPGQFITGRDALSKETGLHRSKIERMLKTFEIEQQIEQQKSNVGRLISILSWDKYQVSEQQDEQRMSNERATDEQRMSTIKNVKNIKNEKNIEEITLNFIEGYEEVWDIWVKYKKEEFNDRYKTKNSEQVAINNLVKISNSDPQVALQIVNNSISSRYKGLFPIKHDTNTTSNQQLSKRDREQQIFEQLGSSLIG